MSLQPLAKQKPLRQRKLNPSGNILFNVIIFIMACVLSLAIIRVFNTVVNNQPSAIAEIKSGYSGYCLDVHRDNTANNAEVDTWKCNGTAAQVWTASGNAVKHNKNYCLSIQNNGVRSGDKIVDNPCNGSPGQVWVSAIDGYENPNSALCLEAPNNQTGSQLIAASCNNLTRQNEAWQASTWSKVNPTASTSCNGAEGQLVACYAAKQWVIWQSGSVGHKTLLNNYSDGNGYEEWCADFVSYIYQEAGYPFANGERNGWDEYLADNIQYQGFTYHSAVDYTPQAGDIAYFNYSGGHVEIVTVGGSKPIYIYGDSGTTDPTTGNGSMTENTLQYKAGEGQLVYYLSPN